MNQKKIYSLKLSSCYIVVIYFGYFTSLAHIFCLIKVFFLVWIFFISYFF